jgi:NADPH:quinone reductase-like Zn-dependent oxidoreductase
VRAITCTGYGRPTDVLQSTDVDDPTFGDDQVLVKVHAASLNPADWHLIRGVPVIARLQIGLRRPRFEIPGSDFAGVVEAIGPSVTTVRPGDEVYGTTFMAGFGAFAEKVAAPERLLVRRPRNVSFEEAAAAPLAALTALQALRDHGKVQPGQKVLVIGASGGVGTYAVQLAKHLGADVTAVCSTRNLDLVASLGADHMVDYTATDVTDFTERYHLVVQIAGTHPAYRLRRLLTRTGTLVQISGDSDNRWVGPLGRLVAGRLQAPVVPQTITAFTVAPNRDDLELLAELLETGSLRSVIDRRDALADLPESLETLESGRTRGKAVLRVVADESGPVPAGSWGLPTSPE